MGNRALERKAQHKGKNRGRDINIIPRTYEGKFAYAGFIFRAVAQCIDALIFGIGIAVSFAAISWATGIWKSDLYGIIYPLWGIGLIWLYSAGFESSHMMATPGKYLFGYRVTDLKGRRISLAKATGRFAGKYLPGFVLVDLLWVLCFPICLAFIYQLADVGSIIVSDRKQAIHDLLAGTIVIYGETERLNQEWDKEWKGMSEEETADGPETEPEKR